MEIAEHISTHHFDFTRAYLGKPLTTGSTIVVPVRKFGVIEGYSAFKDYTFFEECNLVYKGVIKSTREIHEYASPERRDFKQMYTISDGPFEKLKDEEVFLFGLEGVSEDLNAWVDWEIIAAAVEIERTELK